MDAAAIDNIPLELLHSLTPSGMPRHKIVLKVGAVVMLLRNVDKARGLTNGTRLIIRHLHDHFLQCDILTGENKGDRVYIARSTLKPSDTKLPFILIRRQFPIRVSFVMTIDKSQGQQFERLGLFLPTPCFSHGQLYVAFSRARSLKDIVVKLHPFENKQGWFEKDGQTFYVTTNVVYPQVLPPPPPPPQPPRPVPEDLDRIYPDDYFDDEIMEYFDSINTSAPISNHNPPAPIPNENPPAPLSNDNDDDIDFTIAPAT